MYSSSFLSFQYTIQLNWAKTMKLTFDLWILRERVKNAVWRTVLILTFHVRLVVFTKYSITSVTSNSLPPCNNYILPWLTFNLKADGVVWLATIIASFCQLILNVCLIKNRAWLCTILIIVILGDLRSDSVLTMCSFNIIVFTQNGLLVLCEKTVLIICQNK